MPRPCASKAIADREQSAQPPPQVKEDMFPAMVTAAATAFTLTPTPYHLVHQPLATRAMPDVMMNSARAGDDDLSSGAMCHLLSGEQLAAVSDLMSQGAGKDYGYVVCEEPSEDPGMTCFLKPENWSKEVPQQGDWLCMKNPSINLTPTMGGDDSY